MLHRLRASGPGAPEIAELASLLADGLKLDLEDADGAPMGLLEVDDDDDADEVFPRCDGARGGRPPLVKARERSPLQEPTEPPRLVVSAKRQAFVTELLWGSLQAEGGSGRGVEEAAVQ
jgi:hypothetical protein